MSESANPENHSPNKLCWNCDGTRLYVGDTGGRIFAFDAGTRITLVNDEDLQQIRQRKWMNDPTEGAHL